MSWTTWKLLIITTVLIIVFAAFEPWKSCSDMRNSSPSEEIAESDTVKAMQAYNANDLNTAYTHFAHLTEADPENASFWAWRAESERRLNKFEAAEKSARIALKIEPCNSFAHSVLADILNPQYGYENADYDLNWMHLMRAVECNPGEGNAWLSIWSEAMHWTDQVKEKQALVQIHALRFFPGCWFALMRWIMRDLPKNTVLLVYGDTDTYPALVLQEVGRFRPDIAVININLLNLPWYAALMARRHELPLPLSLPQMQMYVPTTDPSDESLRPRALFLSDLILRHWQKTSESGEFRRPLFVSRTNPTELLEHFPGHMRPRGTGWLWVEAGSERMDTDAALATFAGLDGKEFAGRPWSDQDRSAMRRSSREGDASEAVLAAGIELVEQLVIAGRSDEAVRLHSWLRTFAIHAQAPEWMRVQLARVSTAAVSGSGD